ncbi:MAG: NYN domain-containing protein [Candidatus Omnitrophica bacterium]|nr:NYN domain-containing protein [Candidatus Omnitrophota bacterium]
MQYIIDGYNVINHPLFCPGHKKIKKDCRIVFLELIRTKRLCGSPKNKVTVVFDGYANIPELKRDHSDIDVIFSREETADEKIKKLIERCDKPGNIAVVSDDKEIKFFARALGSRSVSVEEFIRPRENSPGIEEKDILKPELTYSQILRINQELKEVWLKNKYAR